MKKQQRTTTLVAVIAVLMVWMPSRAMAVRNTARADLDSSTLSLPHTADSMEPSAGGSRSLQAAAKPILAKVEVSQGYGKWLLANKGYLSRIIYVGWLPRTEVIKACKNVVLGKTTITLDTRKIVKRDGTLGKSGVITAKVLKHFSCTAVNPKTKKTVLNPQVNAGAIFARLAVPKNLEHIIDCSPYTTKCRLFAAVAAKDASKTPVAKVTFQTKTIPKANPYGRRLQQQDRIDKLRRRIEVGLLSIFELLGTVIVQCFPASARLQLENGRHVRMDELQLGDRVLALHNGVPTYQEVYLWGHRDKQAVSPFVEIHTAGNASIRMTRDHYIHVVPSRKVQSGHHPTWKDVIHLPAAQVDVGDYLLHASFGSPQHFAQPPGKPQFVQVTSVKEVFGRGLYNPYTMNGNIVVDGLSVSSHSSMALDTLVGTGPHAPHVYQVMFAPVRLLYRMSPGLVAHIDGLYSEDGWEQATAVQIARHMVQYAGKA